MDGFSEIAVAIPADELSRNYEQRLSWLAIDKRKADRKAWWCQMGMVGLGACLFASCAAIYHMMPLKTTEVLIATVRNDGTWDIRQSVPENDKVAVIETTLWHYVRHHEHFNVSDAPLDWDIVTTMSGPEVRQQYTQAMDPDNPKSPMKLWAGRKEISVRFLGGYFPEGMHAPDYSNGVYTIRYEQRTRERDAPDTCQRMTVNIQYKSVASVPWYLRLQENPLGIIVTEYPHPEPEAPAQPCGAP